MKKNLKILIQDLELASSLNSRQKFTADTSAYLDKIMRAKVTLTKTMTTEKQTDYENPWIFNGHPFYLRTLTTISVLSIALQTHSQVKDTSDGNTFTNYENLEVEVGELKVKATGKNTTRLLVNLLKIAKVRKSGLQTRHISST